MHKPDYMSSYFRGESWHHSIECLANKIENIEFDGIAGIESLGFTIGSTLAYVLNKTFIPIRKVPSGIFVKKSVRLKHYSMGYSNLYIPECSANEIADKKIIIADDTIRYGEHAQSSFELIRKHNGIPKAIAVFINIDQHIRKISFKEPVISLTTTISER